MSRTPHHIDTKTPDRSDKNGETTLLDYAHGLWNEGRLKRESCRQVSAIALDRKTYRGLLRPQGYEEGTRLFALNLCQSFIDVMTAQLTDNRPIMRVEAFGDMKALSSPLEKWSRDVVWEESRAQRQIFRIAHTAAIEGAAGSHVSYSNVNQSIKVEMLYTSQISIDRNIVEAAMIDEAEYVIVRRDVPLSLIREVFPFRGSAVKADTTGHAEASRQVVHTPVEDVLGKGDRKKPSDTIEMARVYDLSLIDRESRVSGELAFPRRRRIVFTKDVILDDGPNPYWDGLPGVDIFDWAVDPENPWGLSAAEMMRMAQISFNTIMDGNIQNQITLNMVNLVMDQNALDPRDLRNMRRMKNVNILSHRRNANVKLEPPPSFGQDKILLAREIFSYLQTIMGVPEVTFGESPGSLQSGKAVRGLQEGANLMTRSRASRLEDFIARIGQKIVARTLQFITPEDMAMLLGKTDEVKAYSVERGKFLLRDGKKPTIEERAKMLRLLRFAVVPGSGAPGAAENRAQAMLGLHLLPRPLVPGIEVLKAGDIANPEDMIKAARQESPPQEDDEGKGVSPGLMNQVPPIFAGAR